MISRKSILAISACGLIATGLAACSSDDSGSGGTINGAGSTFAAPLYSEWGSQFNDQEGITVNYAAVGSGDGQAQFIAGTVDWAGTDPALEDSQIKQVEDKDGTEPVHIPTALGAVTVSYNLPGVKSGLKLDGATIADIFLGNITKWNDPAIAKLNPDVSLPDTDITVVHRSDDSGTTKLFTTFLADYSKDWESQVGVDSTVKWPVGTGAKGNDGVAGGVQQTEGAIGYVELAFALQNDFTTADVQNAAGEFVGPTLDSTVAAGASLKVPSDLRLSAINAPGAKSYPIASITHILAYKDMCKAGLSEPTADDVVKWLEFGLGDGQKIAPQLQYAPLPDNVLKPAQEAVAGLECNGQTIKAPLSG